MHKKKDVFRQEHLLFVYMPHGNTTPSAQAYVPLKYDRSPDSEYRAHNLTSQVCPRHVIPSQTASAQWLRRHRLTGRI